MCRSSRFAIFEFSSTNLELLDQMGNAFVVSLSVRLLIVFWTCQPLFLLTR